MGRRGLTARVFCHSKRYNAMNAVVVSPVDSQSPFKPIMFCDYENPKMCHLYDVAFKSLYIYKRFPRVHHGFCTDLAGSNNLEMAKAESILETIVEMQGEMKPLYFEKDEAKKVCRQVKRSLLKDLSRFLVVCSYLPFLNNSKMFYLSLTTRMNA